MTRLERKAIFIRVLAEYIAGNAARKSIELEMGRAHAQEWARVRQASPVFGHVTVDEAEKLLAEFLG